MKERKRKKETRKEIFRNNEKDRTERKNDKNLEK